MPSALGWSNAATASSRLRDHLAFGKRHLAVLGSEASRRAARFFGFAEFHVGESDGEGVNPALRTAGDGGNRRRIEAAA